MLLACALLWARHALLWMSTRAATQGCSSARPRQAPRALQPALPPARTTQPLCSAPPTSRSSVLVMLPSGLLGEVRNTILGLCSATARLMPAGAPSRGGQAQRCAVTQAAGCSPVSLALGCSPAPQPALPPQRTEQPRAAGRCCWVLGVAGHYSVLLPGAAAPHPPSTSIRKPSRRGTVTTEAPLTAASKTYMVKVGGQSTILSPGSSTQRMSRSMSSSAPQPTCGHARWRRRMGRAWRGPQKQEREGEQGRSSHPGSCPSLHFYKRRSQAHHSQYAHSRRHRALLFAGVLPPPGSRLTPARPPAHRHAPPRTSRCSMGTPCHLASASRSRRDSGSG